MTHRSIAVPLVAVMIPFDKVQLSIFICGVHSKLSSKYILCMPPAWKSKNPFHIREKTLAHLLFYFQIRFEKIFFSCLLVAEVNAPLKASSVFLDTSSEIVKIRKK
jgi:hypothetical protein